MIAYYTMTAITSVLILYYINKRYAPIRAKERAEYACAMIVGCLLGIAWPIIWGIGFANGLLKLWRNFYA